MKVINEITAIQEISEYYRCTGKKIALVPTMGYLHMGHVSLMVRAKDENDIVVVSIFVNPTQFGPKEDFQKYPRDFMRDYYICESASINYIFYPDVNEMYKKNHFTHVVVSDITGKLEGESRPGHFTGVATVVTKLLNAVKPHRLYLGQKDAQQNVVIKKMVSDLNMDTEVVICETMREENGLAMSSRNSYLTFEDKENSSVLYEILKEGEKIITLEKNGNAEEVKRKMSEIFKQKAPGASLEYYAITDNELLDPINDLNNYKGEVLISIAAKFGSTRLIDNVIFTKE
jgi:pantoate--beta-alanine ligase